jgi:hypothetical protein
MGSDDIRLYNEFVPSAAVGIYRETTGDIRLSDADAQDRAYPLLPKVGDTAEVRKRKLDAIKSLPIIMGEMGPVEAPPEATDQEIGQLYGDAFSSAVSRALKTASATTPAAVPRATHRWNPVTQKVEEIR